MSSSVRNQCCVECRRSGKVLRGQGCGWWRVEKSVENGEPSKCLCWVAGLVLVLHYILQCCTLSAAVNHKHLNYLHFSDFLSCVGS